MRITKLIILIFLTMFFTNKTMQKPNKWVEELNRAIEKNDTELVQLLVDHNANVNTPWNENDDEIIPLHLAVKKEDSLAIVKMLLDAKAHINQQNLTGMPLMALDIAVWYNNFEIVKVLIERGADISEDILLKFYRNKNNLNAEKITKYIIKKAVKAELEKYLIPDIAGIVLEHEI